MSENTEEKERQYQVVVTQKDIRDIKQEVASLSNKVNDVHTAIIGSPLAKDGGMVQRLLDCEAGVEHVKEQVVLVEKEMQEKIEEAKRANLKSELYIKIIWGLGGSLAAGVFTTIMYLYFKK
jgi:hypothetical protein